ncbi:EAL domain-containing protein [Sulfurimonas sp.]|uniref:EAL domain-containing protein n=1 Tax=Sulfurimonas sp. TaxID=2022749 RepID=UPI002604ED97|nr:EAL domain-containing protein [Sulfurimonas sp.]MDD5157530.1 EAL domain-containing protein [Sulfurimonas sp.]
MEFIILESILSSLSISFYVTEPLYEALKAMQEHKISSVVVVDEHSKPVGIFTEHDTLRIVSENIDTDKSLGDVMTPSPFCIDQSTHLHDAYMIMEEKGYRHLVVVDKNGIFVGIITEGDFLRHIGFEELNKINVVADVMSKTPFTVSDNASVEEIVLLMKNQKSDYVVLMSGAKPVGIVSERDILHYCGHAKKPYNKSILNLANSKLETITKDLSLYEATALMTRHGVHQLIVLDENHELVGSLSRHDILRAVHGNYFDFLIWLIDNKNSVISKLEKNKKELKNEKEIINTSKLKYQKLFESIHDGILLIDTVTLKAVEFNYAAHHCLGYTAEEFANLTISDYQKNESPEEINSHIDKIKQSGSDSFETVHHAKDGRLIDTFIVVSVINISGTNYMMAIYRDISEQKAKEKELYQKDNDFNTAQALAHVGSWKFNIRTEVLEFSDETYRIFGIEIGLPISYKILFEHIYHEDLEMAIRAWEEAMSTRYYDMEHRIIVDGEIRWVREFAKFEADKHGNVTNVIGTTQEITQRKLYENRLETLANYDTLTGLVNRSYLVSHLQKSIKQADRTNKQIALLIFDLDRFKDINDSYGHNAGDELLKQVADRFSMRLRGGDIVSRLGGDEFAIILKDITNTEDAGRIAQEMIESLSAEYKLSGGISGHIGSSVGIVLFPDNAKDAFTLLQYADAALYKAKAEGRGIYCYYTDELTDLAKKRLKCEEHLRKAVVNSEFEVYYQPQVHIKSGRILGAEALIRWNHPEQGMVSPAEFIPIAEDTGLINEIGEWILNETCRQGKIWLDLGYRLVLAVNLSAHQVRYTNVPLIVEKALKKSGYHADKLELELTESALMQREEETVQMLHTLRAKGIRLAIDDFGTGYSSLSYLKRFPIDVLKIDKSFIDDIPYESDDMAIVTAIIAMGKALNFQVLAEGVEYAEQLEFLKEKRCTMYQGYFKSEPIPAKEFEILLNTQKNCEIDFII